MTSTLGWPSIRDDAEDRSLAKELAKKAVESGETFKEANGVTYAIVNFSPLCKYNFDNAIQHLLSKRLVWLRDLVMSENLDAGKEIAASVNEFCFQQAFEYFYENISDYDENVLDK